jgi:hypothetical protein
MTKIMMNRLNVQKGGDLNAQVDMPEFFVGENSTYTANDNLVGKDIVMVEMPNDPDPIKTGSLGTIQGINHLETMDDQIFVRWDNGRSLSIIAGTDIFQVLE